MTEQVIDASVAIKWVVRNEPYRNKARQLLRDSRLQGITLNAPPLLEYEVESNLQRRVYQGRASTTVADASLQAFYAVGVQITGHPDMVRRARGIARRFNQQLVYDALYGALAELRNCEFWTADRLFYEAVSSELAFVRYIADYQ